MRWITLLLTAAVVCLIPASAEVTTNEIVPYSQEIYLPCIGETVSLSGSSHIVSTVTIDATGGIHLQSHAQLVGVSGTGLTSGDTYRAAGTEQNSENTNAPLPFTSSYVATFRLIGRGPGADFWLHQTIHLTINADGTVTADISNTSGSCK